jgi:glucokinase
MQYSKTVLIEKIERTAMILAGDVGGTKCNLGLFTRNGPGLRSVFQRRLPTRDYSGFEDLIGDFLERAAGPNGNSRSREIEAAGFGLAGVVVDGSLHAGNLPWVLNGSALAEKLHLDKVVLLNDLTATALSLDRLGSNDFAILNEGVAEPKATKVVIAAGTGLGEAILFWNGEQHRVAPSEGGQADFAPRTELDIRLLAHLNKQLPHVSCEEIISGRGFRIIHEFLKPALRHPSFDAPEGDAAREITQLGLAESCPVCVQTLQVWTDAYGAEAGNFALRTVALGGVYVAGGIAPKILSKLQDGAFLRAFCGKSKFAAVLARIPIAVVMNEDAPVWGAAYQALSSEPRS